MVSPGRTSMTGTENELKGYGDGFLEVKGRSKERHDDKIQEAAPLPENTSRLYEIKIITMYWA